MRYWFRGKRGALLAFLLIVALLAGGLGWITDAALALERQHREASAEAELHAQLQLALSLLDSRVRPFLTREDSRAYNHYSAIYAPSLVFNSDGNPYAGGTVLAPSPLLHADLPEWMLLHFQVDRESGWASPQVLSPFLLERLGSPAFQSLLVNATPQRGELLHDLEAHLSTRAVLRTLQEHEAELQAPGGSHETTLVPGNFMALNNNADPAVQQPVQQMIDPAYLKRAQQQSDQQQKINPFKDDLDVAETNLIRNGVNWLHRDLTNKKARSQQADVNLSPLVPLWLKTEDGRDLLMVVRLVSIGKRRTCQGILLDGPRLQELLADEVRDLFPEARVLPVHEQLPAQPERTLRAMTALPFQLDPGPEPPLPPPGWTPLRIGLTLAWVAALVALLAVGLGGWSLLDLSERRIRFVSAVTHELRTPLTTLRLYLDMLTGGLVTDEQQAREYLHTLHAEAERLNRLIGNVLDYSRLENQRPRLVKKTVPVADLLEQVRSAWQRRCDDAGKELVAENLLAGAPVVETDPDLVQQILGNLIDNACKYSQEAADRHVWLRARAEGGRLVLEVEDRGPGVPFAERRSIFRAFRRGWAKHATVGGVGLGLALARRWAGLLGGSLGLGAPRTGGGACFRLVLPLAAS
jgi:signal transduction histidine kinase